MDVISKANEFIVNHTGEVNPKYRLNYHMMPPVGWMNDPNGLVYFNGEYHLYYQFNPFDANTGKMLWGHFVSKDLITYEDCGAALAPEGEHESAFSGGAVECGGEICALYTLHTETEEFKTEEVYKTTSKDGRAFARGVKVFDNENLPANICRTDFRDPCPVKIDGKYYVFVGGRENVLNKGVIIVLSGDTLDSLKYAFCLGPYYELGDMGECPSYFKVNGKDVIIASGCHVHERDNDFKNVNSSVFIVGELDFKKGEMRVDFIKEIDKGDTFYAPQFISGLEKPVMVGWLEMWNKPYPTRDMNHGWVGAFSIPREIEVRDGDVFQKPVKSLENYEQEASAWEVTRCSLITLGFNGKGSFTIEGDNGRVTVGNDGGIYLDTRLANNSFGSIRRTNGRYKNCEVRVLLDVSSIEVFVDGGREVISSRIYIDGDYSLSVKGKISSVAVKKIGGSR